MALTGFLLIVFVLGHMAGNLLIYAGERSLDNYAALLKGNPVLLWTARTVLLVAFLLHVGIGSFLTTENTAARPVPYVYERAIASPWPARHMMLTGLVILAFLIFHLAHFTLRLVQPGTFSKHEVYQMSLAAYKVWWITVTYLVAQVFLFLHLWHGASSWFQSLGFNHPRWNRFFRGFGPGFATLILVGNCSIPLGVVAGVIS
jgi:succinate dehydrogenase / fumarate reductase cytochrome b subunit